MVFLLWGQSEQTDYEERRKNYPEKKIKKKRGRGSYAQVVCNKNKIAIVKWYDNKCVMHCASYTVCGSLPERTWKKKCQGVVQI